MKLNFTCMECAFDGLNFTKRAFNIYQNINESGIYILDCPEGHRRPTVIKAAKFELLFELSMYAIADGYYREAFASFTSSLERFYEFYFKVISFKHQLSLEQFNTAWKNVKSSSERQLGGFIFAYFFENKTPAKIMETKDVSKRNDVIHKGKFPTKEESIEYGKLVYSLIGSVLGELKEKHYDLITKVLESELDEKKSNLGGQEVTHMYFAGFMGVLNQVDNNLYTGGFDNYLKALEEVTNYSRQFPKGFWTQTNPQTGAYERIGV
jgi:hypothetical protein